MLPLLLFSGLAYISPAPSAMPGAFDTLYMDTSVPGFPAPVLMSGVMLKRLPNPATLDVQASRGCASAANLVSRIGRYVSPASCEQKWPAASVSQRAHNFLAAKRDTQLVFEQSKFKRDESLRVEPWSQ